MHNIKSVFLELNGAPYQMHVFREMQFVSHCYTVVSCPPILRHSIYKNSAVYLSGARVRIFLEIRDLGSPTITTKQALFLADSLVTFVFDIPDDFLDYICTFSGKTWVDVA